jgi:hypothetical protein
VGGHHYVVASPAIDNSLSLPICSECLPQQPTDLHIARMATFPREVRLPDYNRRRDSSPHNTSRRRPKLLRACATEPSITASNASCGALATPDSTRRATELLNRVAVFASPSVDPGRATARNLLRVHSHEVEGLGGGDGQISLNQDIMHPSRNQCRCCTHISRAV